jgi:hypothetical protein
MPPSLFARRGRSSGCECRGMIRSRASGSLAFPGDSTSFAACAFGVGSWPVVVQCRSAARRRLAYSAVGDASRVARPVAKRLPQGCFKELPSVDVITGVHSRKTEALLRRSAAKHSMRSAFVGSHHPDGLLHRRLAGLLHPAADPGVHRVSAHCQTCPSWLPRFPTDASPSRAFPSRAAVPRVAAWPCPLAVADVRGRRRLRGLLPLGSPLRDPTVADRFTPEALLGFPHLEHALACRPTEVGGLPR